MVCRVVDGEKELELLVGGDGERLVWRKTWI